MTARVAKRSAAFNNAAGVADSLPRTAAKLAYYQALMLAYGLVGRCAQVRSGFKRRSLQQSIAGLLQLSGPLTAFVQPCCQSIQLQQLARALWSCPSVHSCCGHCY